MGRIGDLEVYMTPERPISPGLGRVLPLIGCDLHRTISRNPRFRRRDDPKHPEVSKESCVMASMVLAALLRAVGVQARTRTVVFHIRYCDDAAKEVRRMLTIGHPEDTPTTSERWRGHMVVEAEGYLIDTTLYPIIRPEWSMFPRMVMVPMVSAPEPGYLDLPTLAVLGNEVDGQHSIVAGWMDYPSFVPPGNNDTDRRRWEVALRKLIAKARGP